MVIENKSALKATKIVITGTVQGVGFRPFVYRLAKELKITGTVKNCGATVEIIAFGKDDILASFEKRLQAEAPPAAQIEKISSSDFQTPVSAYKQFQIIASGEIHMDSTAHVSADLATCKDCLHELFSIEDRRYRYPFLNCTNCGPRFTIIEKLPYDRVHTAMKEFPMCSSCNSEYKDPLDRRFHAQPNACRLCGPKLSFCAKKDSRFEVLEEEEALQLAETYLKDGKIVALKGLGGFHLAVMATSTKTVRLLRERKSRQKKPFAIMMSNLAMVEKYCIVSPKEAELLQNHIRPIVLLRLKNLGNLSDQIAPGLDELGIMLPYTPLHHLLARDLAAPLVMTSANLSDEPIAIDNDDALERLSSIADGFLLNDRNIYQRYDDSIIRAPLSEFHILRRARGYAPSPLSLSHTAKVPVLALGGHLKNTFCLLKSSNAYLSQHIGNLDTLAAREHFEKTLKLYIELTGIEPQLIARDMHDSYANSHMLDDWQKNKTKAPFNLEFVKKIIPVQHHHAHIVSCMVEHNIEGPVLGIAFDGIGYGGDGDAWGGEFLESIYSNFKRLAHIENIAMPGSTKAIEEPWRMKLAYLLQNREGLRQKRALDQMTKEHGTKTIETLTQLIDSKSNCPHTSSAGRLFDAVSSILNICHKIDYEGEAAIILEARARQSSYKLFLTPLPFEIIESKDKNSPLVLSFRECIEALLEELEKKELTKCTIEDLAFRFHLSLACAITRTATIIRDRKKLNTICLSGGVFQNKLLSNLTGQKLKEAEFDVYFNSRVPGNDGGLSLGQAIIASSQNG